MIDQPTAEQELKELAVLVGEWALQATGPDGEPWPGEASLTFEWLEGSENRLLVERSFVEMPEAPNAVTVIGCDAAKGTYFQLYTDDRGVCRIFEMTIGAGRWTLLREGAAPFDQRFNATISEDGNTIEGRWEAKKTGDEWETDFDLVFTRVK
jgi:hypothetical protein